MKLIWNGHACFTLESEDYRIVLDPYTLEVYPPLSVEADEALCSHGHRDHCHTEAVTFRTDGKSPFAVRKLATFHDGEKGALRGENTVHIIDGEGMRIVHCGDLGHLLSGEQLAALLGKRALDGKGQIAKEIGNEHQQHGQGPHQGTNGLGGQVAADPVQVLIHRAA